MCSTPAPASHTRSFPQTRRKPCKGLVGEACGNMPPILPTNAPNHLSVQQHVPMRQEPMLSIFNAVSQGCLQRMQHRSRPQHPESASLGTRNEKKTLVLAESHASGTNGRDPCGIDVLASPRLDQELSCARDMGKPLTLRQGNHNPPPSLKSPQKQIGLFWGIFPWLASFCHASLLGPRALMPRGI